jgi:hypothetical protein
MNRRRRSRSRSDVVVCGHAACFCDTMVLRRVLLAVFLALTSACTDEVLGELDTTSCEGPVWSAKYDLGNDRWSDTGGEAAESGGTVLVVWQERRHNGGDDRRLGALLLDAATGEELRTLTAPTGDYGDVWVRSVDGGFYVFADEVSSSTEVYFVAHDSPRFVYVAAFPSWYSDVVTTSLGVLALAADGVHPFDHFGVAGEVHTDDMQRECGAGTVLRDGRVFAWCFDRRTSRQSLVTMNADGSDPVELSTTRPNRLWWPARLATGNAGIFYVDAGDGEVSVALLNDDGTQRVTAVPVPLTTRERSGNTFIIGAGTCSASCRGLQIVAEGNTALLEVNTGVIERFLVHTDGSSLTFESLGTHDTTSQSGLTTAQPGALSVQTRFSWHVAALNLFPPPSVVVERLCLRQPIDDLAVDD